MALNIWLNLSSYFLNLRFSFSFSVSSSEAIELMSSMFSTNIELPSLSFDYETISA
jgi:hypothetical protein